jgi:hypothetical protein
MDNLEILKMLFIQNFNMEMVASDLIDMIAPKKLEKYIYQKFKDEFDIEELEKLDTSEVLDYIQEIWEIEIVESDDLAENILFEISNVIDEYSREYYKTENEQEKKRIRDIVKGLEETKEIIYNELRKMDKKENKIFVVTENWEIKYGDKGANATTFSNLEKAKEHFELLKKNYLVDFESEHLQLTDNENSFFGINGMNGEYFEITIEKQEIK